MICQQLIIKVYLSLGLMLVVIVPFVISPQDSGASVTNPTFFPGPGGEPCINREEHLQIYLYTDENGLQCYRLLCKHGQRLLRNYSCDPMINKPQPSDCELVEQGHFMNASNKCSQGYQCKQCPYPLQVKMLCIPQGPDTVCSCVDDYYMILRDKCEPFPRCDAGYEARPGHGEHGTENMCQPCHDGYFQPTNNSTNKCQKIRKCTIQEGTSHSDAVCLNDPVHLLPTDGLAKTTKSDETVLSTQTSSVGSEETVLTTQTSSVGGDETSTEPPTDEPAGISSWLYALVVFTSLVVVEHLVIGIGCAVFVRNLDLSS